MVTAAKIRIVEKSGNRRIVLSDGSVWKAGHSYRKIVQSWPIGKYVQLVRMENPVNHYYTHYLVSQDTEEMVLVGPWLVPPLGAIRSGP